MPEQVPNKVQSNQDVNSHSANNSALSQLKPILVIFLLYDTREYINSYPRGKLCIVRVAQLEIPPSQLVTGIFSYVSLCLLLLFSFSCVVLVFHLDDKEKALVAARNCSVKPF